MQEYQHYDAKKYSILVMNSKILPIFLSFSALTHKVNFLVYGFLIIAINISLEISQAIGIFMKGTIKNECRKCHLVWPIS